MKTLERVCWSVTLLLTVAAGFRMLNLWMSAGASAPQVAAEAASIMIMVLVPYVFSRAIQGLRSDRPPH